MGGQGRRTSLFLVGCWCGPSLAVYVVSLATVGSELVPGLSSLTQRLLLQPGPF